MGYWYLLNEKEPRGAAANMAADQYLLDLMEAGTLDRPVLRLYAWSRPTLSLGYHQRWQDTVNKEALEQYGIDLVGRWTGGRGVLHEPDELTYSVIAPLKEPFGPRVTHNYRLIGAALERFSYVPGVVASMAEGREEPASVRAQRGLPCFATTSQSEIETGGQKLIGSAQKLGHAAFLQHGSIPRSHRIAVLEEITRSKRDVSGTMTGMDNLYEAAGMAFPDREGMATKLIRSFSEVFGVDFVGLDEIDEPDETQIEHLAATRFAQDSWTYRK